ncbi:hypothetical protein [Aureimonas mangrovi]|uniref:hypothetical protein n=1 Tax=Aureimonas mangrovi TaxID=2758041 RepID=UPI00163DCB8E|nr:hypothetical protein [Aureimonas mangrovi]
MTADPDFVRALKRYARRRAAGRPAAEWAVVAYIEPEDEAGNSAAWWREAGAVEAAATKQARQLRTDGEPWCRWLGRDLRIASDRDLQAYFVTVGDDLSAWSRLRLDVHRHPSRTLDTWTRKGRRIRSAVSKGAVPTDIPLAARFARRGDGRRSLQGL